MKDIRYQAYFLMNYESNTFGMDVVVAITAKGEPYVRPKADSSYLNKEFLSNRINQEEETSYLMTMYYNLYIEHTYKNQHRMCTIRELEKSDIEEEEEENDDSIIVKKYEDF